MAQPEVARGQLQRLTGEDVAGPGARVARQQNRLDARAPVHGLLRPDHHRVARRAGGIVAARHVDLDVSKPALGEVRLERRERVGGGHVRHQPQVELRHRPMRQNRLAAGPRVAADQSLDVDGGTGHQHLERLRPARVVRPPLHAELLLRRGFIEPRGRGRDHGLFVRSERPSLIGEIVDRGIVAVGRYQRRECLHEVPGGAVDFGFIARMNVGARPAAPALAARHQLALDYALGAQRDGDLAVEPLRGRRHEDAGAPLQGREHLGPADDLREMRRPDLLFALGDEHEIDRELAARAPDGMQGGEERGLGALLVHRTAPHHDLAQAGFVHECGVPRRRGPFCGIDLFNVVHEVQAERFGRARVERREDARLAVARDPRDLLEARLAQHPHRQLAAFVHT